MPADVEVQSAAQADKDNRRRIGIRIYCTLKLTEIKSGSVVEVDASREIRNRKSSLAEQPVVEMEVSELNELRFAVGFAAMLIN